MIKKRWMVMLLVAGITAHIQASAKNIVVKDKAGLYAAAKQLAPGDNLQLADGIYNNLQINFAKSGTANLPITINALHEGKAVVSGNAKIEISGTNIILSGLVFKNGNRNPDEWKSHGPGLVAIYGSYNRITNCMFDDFDDATSAWITTSLDAKGNVPTHCRIDHCRFTDKVTFDQVINLNNTPAKSDVGGPAMYHRVDHCFFSNPKKKGNAGGAIRVSFYRYDIGRCLIDSNIFMRQDSESEIITSKSQQNVYYNNLFLNCQGTMNFRHGDNQAAINNFFIGDDNKYEYGGMYVWGSNHLIANNYFSLKRTLTARGNAAVYFNIGITGSEHALAFNIKMLNNIFANVNGYAINFNPMVSNRTKFAEERNKPLELTHDILIKNNLFYTDLKNNNPFFLYDNEDANRNIVFDNCTYYGSSTGLKNNSGFTNTKPPFTTISNISIPVLPSIIPTDYKNYDGMNVNLSKLVAQGISKKLITLPEILPAWMQPLQNDYCYTGIVRDDLKNRLKKHADSRSE